MEGRVAPFFRVVNLAVEKYVERGRYMLAGLLPKGFEVYEVTPARVRHPEQGEDPREWACIQCRKLIENSDTYRIIVSRRAGTMWTDGEYWRVHNVPCFMGRDLKPR